MRERKGLRLSKIQESDIGKARLQKLAEVLSVKMQRRRQELGDDFVIEEAIGSAEQPSQSQSGSASSGNKAPRARKTAKNKGTRGFFRKD